MSIRTHLYTLTILQSLSATISLLSPICPFSTTPFQYLASVTGLHTPSPTRARAQEITICLMMYMLSIIYLWGGKHNVKGVRTAAFIGILIYITGSVVTCLLRPELDGTIVMAVTATGYMLIAAWMMCEPGLLVEAREFLAGLPYCEEGKKLGKDKERVDRVMEDMAKQR
ncbi:hypothetical protein BZA77DRAFT_125586 [Pyronema omphalodes]|nr:hypothetical protein BZA77DRAFT_125586 [Pyronema omphalodes]